MVKFDQRDPECASHLSSRNSLVSTNNSKMLCPSLLSDSMRWLKYPRSHLLAACTARVDKLREEAKTAAPV